MTRHTNKETAIRLEFVLITSKETRNAYVDVFKRIIGLKKKTSIQEDVFMFGESEVMCDALMY
jgi:hypothetical protein